MNALQALGILAGFGLMLFVLAFIFGACVAASRADEQTERQRREGQE